MANYAWPKQGTAVHIGKSPDRIDGLPKTTGAAKYAYDIALPKMLFARLLGCPHAHCTIKSIDLSGAEKTPGVVAVTAMKKDGNEIQWQGDHIACVAAESDAAAMEGIQAIKVEYEMLPVFVKDEDIEAAKEAGRVVASKPSIALEAPEPEDENADLDKFQTDEIERLFEESDVVLEGEYGVPVISHMCLEPHGSTVEWKDGKLTAYLSTQFVAGTPQQFAEPLEIAASDVTVICNYVGGGFGSKFGADAWGVEAAKISKQTGRPVKLMLDRDLELKIAGNRPSAFIKVRVGADKEGVVKIWDSQHWGTAGGNPDGSGNVDVGQVPYVFKPGNRRSQLMPVLTNAGPARAWRAPPHPQACAITQTAYDDLAAKLGLNSYDVFLRNLPSVAPSKVWADGSKHSMAETYREQMEIAAKLMDWQAKWHPHGKGEAQGSVVTGLGMALHTWGGGGHASSCKVRIATDGSVEVSLASQDIGTGTRTVINQVVAETFGLPLSGVKVSLGNSKYPQSGPSGGSTTIGGVCESTRRGSVDALNAILALAAKKLNVAAETLVAVNGRIQVADAPKKSLSWKEACSLLGMKALEVTGTYDPSNNAETGKLSSSQVGGVQMAEVAVDKSTGEVRMKKFVAVQDIGLVVNPKTAASQVNGAVIMGIAYALFEERIMDAATGAFLNCEIADYKLPRIGDVGEVIVHFHEPASEYERGIVGLGEPPVISPGAAISNAVANALGVRVKSLPLTPQRVLNALAKA